MRRAAFWFSLIVPSLAVVRGVWCGSFPLGVAGEWEWGRVAPVGPLVWILIPPLIAAALYLGIVWLGEQRIERCRAIERGAWLGCLSLSGFAWLWIVQESAPESYQLSKAAWVLYFRGSSGYFSEAREAAGDLPAYLAGYERKMAEGDVLHIGTHPPGLVIVFRTLLATCETFPRLVDLVLFTEPESVGDAFNQLRRAAPNPGNPLLPAHEAVLWLTTLLLQAGVALTIVPLFALLRLTASRRASWLAAAFWPTVPALAVFIPKSDCLYPLLAAGFLWLWLTGLAKQSRTLCILAGVVLWLGLMMSLAFLPVVLVALLATVGDMVWLHGASIPPGDAASRDTSGARPPLGQRLREGMGRCIPAFGWLVAGIAVPSLALWFFLKINLLRVWAWNFHNHAGFYSQFTRTYWKWLVVNPIEFAVAAGAPLAVLAAWSIWRQWRISNERTAGYVWGALATMGLLWLSGKNMGEAARLWIVLMPFLVWIAASLFESPSSSPGSGEPQAGDRLLDGGWNLLPGPGWAIVLALQLVTTIAIVTRVVGFDYHST